MLIPLTLTQQSLLVHARVSAKFLYNVDIEIAFKWKINDQVLQRAIQNLCRKHPILTARIVNAGGRFQFELSEAQVPTIANEITFQNQADYAAWKHTQFRETAFRLFNGELIWFAPVYIAESNRSFLFTIGHHILLDGPSCDLMVRYIGAYVHAALSGEEPGREAFRDAYPQVAALEQTNIQKRSPADIQRYAAALNSVRTLTDLPRERAGTLSRILLPSEQQQKFHTACSAQRVLPLYAMLSLLTLHIQQHARLCEETIVFSFGTRVIYPAMKQEIGHMADLIPLRPQVAQRGPIDWLAVARELQSDLMWRIQKFVPLVEAVRVAHRTGLKLSFLVDSFPAVQLPEDLPIETVRYAQFDESLYAAISAFFIEQADGSMQLAVVFSQDLYDASDVTAAIDGTVAMMKRVAEGQCV